MGMMGGGLIAGTIRTIGAITIRGSSIRRSVSIITLLSRAATGSTATAAGSTSANRPLIKGALLRLVDGAHFEAGLSDGK